jgi:hypothetical protein
MVTKVGKKTLDTNVVAAAASVRVTRSAAKVAVITTAAAIAPDMETAATDHMGDTGHDSSSKTSTRATSR